MGACHNPLVIFFARFAILITAECLCSSKHGVRYTLGHLFQHIAEHKHLAVGKYLRDLHNQMDKDLRDQFTILKKCGGKLDCLIHEMLFIIDKKPQLNNQSDSIKATLFI